MKQPARNLTLPTADIDPVIGAAMQQRFAALTQVASSDPKIGAVQLEAAREWRRATQQYASHFWWPLGIFGSSMSIPLVFARTDDGPSFLAWLGMNAVAAGIAVRAVVRMHKEVSWYVRPETLLVAPRVVEMSPAEAVYCEAVAALIEAGSALGASAQREILLQLNVLLASHRALEAPLRHQTRAVEEAVAEVISLGR